jgi:hypothetical protein
LGWLREAFPPFSSGLRSGRYFFAGAWLESINVKLWPSGALLIFLGLAIFFGRGSRFASKLVLAVYVRIKPIWKGIAKTKSALYSNWIMTCTCMTLRAHILRDKLKAIRQPSVVTRETKGKTASKSVSALS